ncbi:MAG: hypothetical protein GTN89_05320, partial [Acidobacteria bacterium]|nr:hypothetical protein [Acidobacteriota bacterium]NIM61255.1 hypothetical protein [Acidobacteriota bacterium]NIO58753.1 hypothetical protein [Acidobacteriota bacterium]NIQ29789.1 hypothetical protein [Acidobacteriota bacterium]NIQ84860.1 hypothetical protein [Acidobacteriota bacterium]
TKKASAHGSLRVALDRDEKSEADLEARKALTAWAKEVRGEWADVVFKIVSYEATGDDRVETTVRVEAKSAARH